MLTDLRPKAKHQATLFEDVALREKRGRLNATLDSLNGRFGRGTIALAGAGMQKGGSSRRRCGHRRTPRIGISCWW